MAGHHQYAIIDEPKLISMTAIFQVRKAGRDDFKAVCDLLKNEKLPVEDLKEELNLFFIAQVNDEITGSIGLEEYGTDGLLRSMAVKPGYRNSGIAAKLVNQLLDYSREKGIQQLYLITTTAEQYFLKKGFMVTERSNVPAAILASPEFSSLCPSTATVMRREI